MIDYAQMQEDRQQVLSALSTSIAAMTPLLEMAPEAGPALFEMLKWTIAGFKGSSEIEGVLDQMIKVAMQKSQEKQGQQEGPDPKVQEIQAKHMAEMEKEQFRHANKMKELQAGTEASLVETQAETQASSMREQSQAVNAGEEKKIATDLTIIEEQEKSRLKREEMSIEHTYTMKEEANKK